MTTVELAECLKHLSNAERLEVIEAATRLVREQLADSDTNSLIRQNCRLSAAAQRVKEIYEPGGELTEWSALDAEEFVDDYSQG